MMHAPALSGYSGMRAMERVEPPDALRLLLSPISYPSSILVLPP